MIENIAFNGKLLSFSLIFFFVMQTISTAANAEPGLLIVAHGSPSAKWNEPVLELGRKVADALSGDAVQGNAPRFKAVRTAFLEFAEPDVPTAVAALEAEGCDRIIAVPLFIAPSGHTHFDLPAVLGIYFSPEISDLIAKEGGTIARPCVPITLTRTLAGDDFLSRFALDQVKKLSENPKEEALVIIAHGDPGHHDLNEKEMRRIVTYCCGRSGIDYGDWAFVAVGQTYMEHGAPAIEAALSSGKRVIVVGIYISCSATSIHKRAAYFAGRTEGEDSDIFAGESVAFSTEGVVSFEETIQWILDSARSALEPKISGSAAPKQKNGSEFETNDPPSATSGKEKRR